MDTAAHVDGGNPGDADGETCDNDLLAWARGLFSDDRFATVAAGIVIEDVKQNYARCSMQLTPNHLNANGFCMGGAMFTLADFCFAIASNTGEYGTVSVSSSIDFLRATKGPVLFGETRCVRRGRSICFFDVDIADGEGRTVAVAHMTGYRKD